ncbi:MAG: hypothetical protein PHQ52_04140 [Candidatus Omnitrophica bacterium]|nr:hypothetical protein [Candidatus Omnitrophota bacterium]
MKSYTKPKIRSIVLDPEQSVLEICKIGGLYFGTFAQGCISLPVFTNPISATCINSVKGQSRMTDGGTLFYEANTMPS